MTICQHGESSDCLDCEITYHRAILEEFEIMVSAQKRRISELVQRRPVDGMPMNQKPADNVIWWPGLGDK